MLQLGKSAERKGLAFIGKQYCQALGKVQGAAAANADKAVISLAGEILPEILQVRVSRLHRRILENFQFNAGLLYAVQGLEYLGMVEYSLIDNGGDPGITQFFDLFS